MDITMSPLAIQLIGFVGTGLFLASYQCRKNKHLFFFQALAYFFYAVHFLLLGAVTGAVSLAVNLLRSILLSTNFRIAHSKGMCAALCGLQVIVSLATWDRWISLIPCAANIIATIGGYTHNPQKIRLAIMCGNSPLWIVYSILVGSWAGVADELVNEASGIISIIRYGWKNLDEIQD